MLNRDAPYVQIIEHYRQQIRDGRLQDGDMLPSGREIAAEFGVSMATAAKVATGLQALGLVTPRPGAGTIVTAPRPSADKARGGPVLITLATRTPASPATLPVSPPPPGHPAGRGPRRHLDVLVPRLTGRGGPRAADEGPAHRGDRGLPARVGRGLGLGPPAHLSRSARVRDQAWLPR